MKIAIFYFSATGNTSRMVEVIKEKFIGLGVQVDDYDISSYASRQKRYNLNPYQAIVFGAPIHSWRAPRLVREWLRTLDGGNKKCSMFFTYGGFGVHPTHYTTRKILSEQGFVVVSSAEFLGEHTFNLGGWKAMTGRPDESDFQVAREYAAGTYKRFTGEDPEILDELEKTNYREEELDLIEGFRFNILTKVPSRDGENCSMCMLCEELCPAWAMDAQKGLADKEKCIACLRCVAICPESVLKINDMTQTWPFKLEMEKIDESSLQQKQSKSYF